MQALIHCLALNEMPYPRATENYPVALPLSPDRRIAPASRFMHQSLSNS